MKIRWMPFIFLTLFSLIILWYLCPAVANFYATEGHSSSDTQNPAPPVTVTPTPQPAGTPEPPFNYYTLTKDQQDLKLSLHVLEVDAAKVHVKPVSSHSTLFGYEYLSVINDRWKALASVNGGFSHPDGLLGGLYALDDRILIPATGKYPVLFLKENKPFLGDVSSRIWIEEETTNRVVLEGFYFNQYPKGEGLYVFTPDYGSANRIQQAHLNAVFSQGEIRGLTTQNISYEIPKDGFLISAIGKSARDRLKTSITPGMKLKINYETLSEEGPVTDFDWAYECGSWLLREGEVVVPDADTWVGTLTIRTPRTAVALKGDGTLVFVVADGRQPDLSDGLTGLELARELLSLGVKDAVNLDGGASSQLIIDGRIVNSPSAGRERKLAACFVITEK